MMQKFRCGMALVLALMAAPVLAEEMDEKQAFIEANLLSIFYHELGHAVIDIMQVPIFGQEEDAADVMSVLLIDWLYDEDVAQEIAASSAYGFIDDPDREYEITYWGVHGPDEQRFYNHVCLFYGANPDEREDFAADMGLPDERAYSCPEEYELAADSWGGVLDEMDDQKSDITMVFVPGGSGDDAALVNDVLAVEVEHMNKDMRLPQELTVSVEDCGEANAFYDLEDIAIVMCTEFVGHLATLFDEHELDE